MRRKGKEKEKEREKMERGGKEKRGMRGEELPFWTNNELSRGCFTNNSQINGVNMTREEEKRKRKEKEKKKNNVPFSTNNELSRGCFTNNSQINGVSIEFHEGSTSWSKGGVYGEE